MDAMTDRTTAATTKPTVITSEMLDSMANIDKSVGVTEHKNAKYDLGNLMVYVADDYDFSKLDNDTLDELARVNTQHLIARIFNLETKVSEDGRHAILPEPTTRLPRMRPIPEPKPMTTWEKFAARKGIKKKKKALMVVDEQTGEYRRRFGYKKANNIEDQWAIEHKEGQDDSVDPWTAERIKKKARVEKNQRQQRRNMLRAQQANPRNLPGTIDLASAVGKKRLKRNAIKAGKTAEQKSHLEIALATAQRSTASMGKFDQLRKGEPLLKAPKAPRRDAELQNPDVERKQHQSILKKVLGRAKEKDSFVVERAMASIGAGHIRHKELDTARAAQKIGRKVARELKEATGGKKSGSKGKNRDTRMLAINGDLKRGQDVRSQNVTAVIALANIVRSSLGPTGLDKMLVDDIGDVNITNDGATILKQLDVQHPAAKVLVELSNMQDQEVGDGTTSVVLLAAELLRNANELVKNHVHPTSVIAGLNIAKKEACRYIKDNMTVEVSKLPEDAILNVARTSISSKIIGHEGDFFAKMAVDAVMQCEQIGPDGRPKYPINQINILKAHGKSARESELVQGFALNCVRAAQGMPTYIKGAKIALLDIDLRRARLAMGIQVVIKDPSKLEAIRQKEADITKDLITKILDAGANVVLTTKGIDDLALKCFVERKVMAVRRCKKSDLQMIAQATGGKLILSLADENGEETVDPSWFGTCEEVHEAKVGDGELIYFRGCSKRKAQTVILRGANDYMLDEIDRSLHDAMCAVKRCLESKKVVPGGGACEGALSVHMENFAEKHSTREQLAIQAFAQSLLVIPKTLAVNGAYDATDLVAQLRAYHNAALTDPEAKADYKWSGLDLENGKVRNNLAAGVLEPAMSKVKMIRFATEAAITILRIDDSITMKGKDDPSGPHGDHY